MLQMSFGNYAIAKDWRSEKLMADGARNVHRSSPFVCSWRKRQLLEAYRGEIPAGCRVLDVGCGSGAIGKAVVDTFQAKVEGADIVNLLVHDLPFHILPDSWKKWPEQAFDVIMINDALHHMEPETQLFTLRQALRVGRKVLIFETHPTVLAKVADVVMGYFIYGGREAVPLTHRDPEIWCRILEELGCRVNRRDVLKPSFFYPLRHFAITAERL